MIGARCGLVLSIIAVGILGVGLPVAAVAYTSLVPATSPQITMVQMQMNAGITPGGNLGFSPTTVHVVIGVNNTVEWTNNDNSMDAQGYTPQHTVTAMDNSWGTSQSLNPGDTYEYTFQAPGTYSYHCAIHAWMTGTVVVTGTGTATSSTSSSSTTSKTTTTPVPEFPTPLVALFGAIAVVALVLRLGKPWKTGMPQA